MAQTNNDKAPKKGVVCLTYNLSHCKNWQPSTPTNDQNANGALCAHGQNIARYVSVASSTCRFNEKTDVGTFDAFLWQVASWVNACVSL